jgi:FMN phosphatase YigB (HAD superfamily)
MGADSVCVGLARRGPLNQAGSWDEAADALAAVRGLVFDFGDVIYDTTAWRRWLLRLLTRFGVTASYDEVYRVWQRDYLDAVERGEREHGEAFQAWLLSFGLTHGQIDEIEAASQARRRQLAADMRPLPGVRATLASLKAGRLPLAVLCDSEYPAFRLADQLQRMGLSETLPIVISSFDLERTKPDPLCYRSALEALQLPAEQVAYVGHDAEELAGARAIGMPTIAFNFAPDAEADAFVTKFSELLDLLPAAGDGRAADARSRLN